MTVSDVREIVSAAIASKNNFDESTASVLQTEIEKFLSLFTRVIGKNIDTAQKNRPVPSEIEEAVNELRSTYGV